MSKDQPPKTPPLATSATGAVSVQSAAPVPEEILPDEMRRRKPPKEALDAAFQRFQSIAAQVEPAEQSAEFRSGAAERVCPACGRSNRQGNRFCAMCGTILPAAAAPLPVPGRSQAEHPTSQPAPDLAQQAQHEPAATGVHHHHHHHYHYFPGGGDGSRRIVPSSGEPEKTVVLPSAAKSENYGRAETAVRRLSQDWAIACNTRHLEDVLDLYGSDAIMYRSNQPVVRGPAALREFFVAALDAGLGEAALETARVEIAGDMAYEAGKFTALVPGAGGKRREERGKFVRVFSKDAEGDWKITVDCWSSDLTLGVEEPAKAAPPPPRRT